MKSAWRLLKQIAGLGGVTEQEIRDRYTLFVDAWPKPHLPPERAGIPLAFWHLRRRWGDWNLALELYTAGAKTRESFPQSRKPVAHSSLTTVEAFATARAVFKPPAYSVYRVAGNDHLVQPLMGEDAIVVFESVTELALIRQPLQVGDVVILESGDERVLYRITNLGASGESLHAKGMDPIPVGSVESRLVAVFYTQGIRKQFAGEETNEMAGRAHSVFVDAWDEAIFRPTHSDKPTPHSSFRLWGKEKRRLYRAFRYPDYSLWDKVPNTNSMEPLIDVNTTVVFETITERVLKRQPLQVGDIVSWRQADRGAMHRIIGVAENGQEFYVKGDNNRYGDRFGSKRLIPVRSITKRVVGVIYMRQVRHND